VSKCLTFLIHWNLAKQSTAPACRVNLCREFWLVDQIPTDRKRRPFSCKCVNQLAKPQITTLNCQQNFVFNHTASRFHNLSSLSMVLNNTIWYDSKNSCFQARNDKTTIRSQTIYVELKPFQWGILNWWWRTEQEPSSLKPRWAFVLCQTVEFCQIHVKF